MKSILKKLLVMYCKYNLDLHYTIRERANRKHAARIDRISSHQKAKLELSI